jgi:hypothetical protein
MNGLALGNKFLIRVNSAQVSTPTWRETTFSKLSGDRTPATDSSHNLTSLLWCSMYLWLCWRRIVFRTYRLPVYNFSDFVGLSFEEIYDLFRPIKSGIASKNWTCMTVGASKACVLRVWPIVIDMALSCFVSQVLFRYQVCFVLGLVLNLVRECIFLLS